MFRPPSDHCEITHNNTVHFVGAVLCNYQLMHGHE
jgi:hypothetical protein